MLIGDLYLSKRLMRSYPAIFGECLFVAMYHIAYLDRYKDSKFILNADPISNNTRSIVPL